MRIVLLEQAKADLMEASAFYEKQAVGLGSYFLESVAADIDSLSLHAGIHRIVHGPCHRLLCRRFPFGIYYSIAGDSVRIWAILDCRRDPAVISGRLR